jgi:serine/threonine protein phosphatase PrpC
MASLMAFNIGDSRCYSWSEGTTLAMVTKDHSAVQELVDAGSITSAEAWRHPDRNVVTRAIGVDETALADFFVLPKATHQRFLLCSDGVSGQLDADLIAECLADDRAPHEGASILVNHVLEGRATDNATCIVVDVRWGYHIDDALDADDDVTGPRPKGTESVALISDVPSLAAGSSGPRVIRAPISEVP